MQLLQSSLTAVLNGFPGPWFPYRRGLRQGDPMSPYLFLIVANILQAMIKHDGNVRHPLIVGMACPILQYADDMLVVLRGELADVTHLRQLLDLFTQANGLKINYTKSTPVPINVEDEVASQCVSALGCRREGFPHLPWPPPFLHKTEDQDLNL